MSAIVRVYVVCMCILVLRADRHWRHSGHGNNNGRDNGNGHEYGNVFFLLRILLYMHFTIILDVSKHIERKPYALHVNYVNYHPDSESNEAVTTCRPMLSFWLIK